MGKLTKILLIAAMTELAGTSPMLAQESASAVRPPNMIVLFTDDMGYGDITSFGHPTIRTPHLDRLATEGQKWTNFYVAAPVCTPSRAALLTGRLPNRSGLSGSPDGGMRVLFPFSDGGLPSEEVTIAEVLKEEGYTTAAVGKWHLGHQPAFLPTNQGFDSYYGIPYSNDMNATDLFEGWGTEIAANEPDINKWDVPILRDEEEIERPADQRTITRRYTEEAIRVIEENADRPFFLYLAHSLPHVPLFTSEEFIGVSDAGAYGDVIEEIDWSVGRILATLEEQGIAENTLVVFTSDNGPWLIMNQHGGSAGLLRDGKGSTWEGGMRVPTMFYWPGHIAPGVVHSVGSTLDLLPTAAALAGATLPERTLDGVDLSPVLFEGDIADGPRETMFFYRSGELYAVRHGAYKAHFITETTYVADTQRTVHEPPLLFNLQVDPSERFDIAEHHPDVIAEIMEIVVEHSETLEPVPNQLDLYDEDQRDAYFARYMPR